MIGRAIFVGMFAALARELSISIVITYLESHRPKPRNTVSIINSRGEVVLNYSKVFICDFGAEELLKPNRNPHPGESFPVCTPMGAEGEVRVGAMICADREFPEAANSANA